MELRSLALRDELEEEVFGIERIPRVRRIKITKVNINSRVSISVDDGDFRAEIREYLALAILVNVGIGNEIAEKHGSCLI